MAKGNTTSANILKLLFNATSFATIADNTATSPATNLYVALHTADPGAAGTQATSEAAYTSYARVAVVRTTSGWTVSSQSVTPVASITFPACTGSTSTVTHFSIGTTSSGATLLLYSGTVSPTISVSNGVTPILTTATSVTEA